MRNSPYSLIRLGSRPPQRRRRGAQATEFAAALVALVLCVFVPLLDFGIIPVRWGLANQIVQSYAINLSRAETLTKAFDQMIADPSLATLLKRIGGVKAKKIALVLLITKPSDETKRLVIDRPRTIPAAWLPDAQDGPFQYELQLSTTIEVSPLIICNFIDKKVPGLTAPFDIDVTNLSHWENLGRNPATNEFYVNE